jgi:hypothetical protein
MRIENVNPKPEDSWVMAECDFRSLQLVLGLQDGSYSGPNKKPEPDDVAYEIYGKIGDDGKITGVGHNDIHSATSFGVFYKPINKEIYDVTDEAGKSWIFEDSTPLKIKRKNAAGEWETKEIFGKDIDENDQILETLASFGKY